MRTIKVSEATGAVLDWMVAKAEGWEYDDVRNAAMPDRRLKYSTNWAQGGPIIERESIHLTPDQGETYVECVWFAGAVNEAGDEFNGEGPTPLLAAMRCFISSDLGYTVEVPEELT